MPNPSTAFIRHKSFGLIALAALFAVSVACSIIFGVTDIPLSRIIESYTAFNGSNEHLIIRTARVPRALIAACVGASLAVAGALMQAVTRNPLASPSLLGINAGAAFFIVVAASYFEVNGLRSFTWVALSGAAFGALLVYILGSVGRDGMTPVKVTLAGAAVTAFFASLTQGILLSSGKMFDQVLYWLVGSVAGRDVQMLVSVFPYIAAGLICALLLSGQMNALALGDDVAKGLGQRTALVKGAAALVIVLLAGSSVAVAGPIAFVGIIVPHAARYLVGSDHRWLLPYCAVLGGLLLVTADLGSRFIAMPKEVPVGVMTALIGVPFFVYLARGGVSR
ncbi:FecCD family ABC transporter permease [Paenibacillus hamazuiensis]|uniref:FecCD family ABC transporter permease n=1 Tax=Paenibacillus hamazuiensis TaxID=2936508 RepID=UPI00200EAFED|nr:iron ABC transporter permease [Paenibacillus hamazuiensis]